MSKYAGDALSIKNGRVIDPKNHIDRIADIFVQDGRIVAVDSPPPGFVPGGDIDARNWVICPGLVDLSARLGALEPELSAAVGGGITATVCLPDTQPPLDEPGLVERLVRRSAALGLARVVPVGALTQQLAGERLAEMYSLSKAGCVAFSQVQYPIFDTQVLFRAMQYAATFGFAVHLQAQDPCLSRDGVAHDGEFASRRGLPGIPVCAETVAIATALLLAEATGVKLHFGRLSSAAGVALIRKARRAGLNVSCDVAIHHLHLSEDDIGYFDSHARFVPPLRSVGDRNALREAVADGTAALCSDHTPLDEDAKLLPFPDASPGASALELFLPLALKWAEESGLPLETALARVTCDPARILGIDAGNLTVGSAADICVFNPVEVWRVCPETLRSDGKNTPFLGAELTGRVKATLVGGRVVFGGDLVCPPY
ncbi:MAG: dihydroorotase [Candidatus Accumulibacter sp.]|jgi:dihydroorotase|nr:dihydroorotase [Accumulibacter sp.]